MNDHRFLNMYRPQNCASTKQHGFSEKKDFFSTADIPFTRSVTSRKSLAKSGYKASIYDDDGVSLFDLSSHKRAKESIEFALKMRDKGYHAFVVGEDRSGRMTSTLSFLNAHIKKFPAPDDWVYVNNFTNNHKPIPIRLPKGKGRIFQTVIGDLVDDIHIIINRVLNQTNYLKQVEALTVNVQFEIEQDLVRLNGYARKKGFSLEQNNDGFIVEALEEVYDPRDLGLVRERVNKFTTEANLASQTVQEKILETRRVLVEKAIKPLVKKVKRRFDKYCGAWMDQLQAEVLHNIDDFINPEDAPIAPVMKEITEKYSVNLFVDNWDVDHPRVFVESDPSFESIFGSIKYRSNLMSGAVETNFSMMRPGALHVANGGILVLRGDALAKDHELYEALKATIRDKKIRIHEKYRENSLPLIDAPDPKSIPMNVQIFVIASPYWYYNVFSHDPDFKSYFKIKADIDPDLPKTKENKKIYSELIQKNAHYLTKRDVSKEGLAYLLSYSSRWVGNTEKLTSKFELIGDILEEAAALDPSENKITKECIQSVIDHRRYRNKRLEDRSFDDFQSQNILIETDGKKVGQVNGLTVLSHGDHSYGAPSRITAQTYMGKDDGVINIERDVDLAGPIQQKGARIVEGFLKGIFAQDFPLSCSCSLTFEQNYMDIEGDSASMAELIAILSSLSKIPVRQDIAITGSVNQFGEAQAVGGVHYKVEGFYRICKERGLTGKQGVIIPYMNQDNLTLRNHVTKSTKNNEFKIYPVKTVFEAVEILLDTKAGFNLKHLEMGKDFDEESVFKKTYLSLKRFHDLQKADG